MTGLIFYAGVLLGGMIGVFLMCLLQINRMRNPHDDDTKV